ncbi:Leucine-rich repeat-containing protein 34 [Histomonas meleagridis]|uniref:Leucine-rich repeat-containing protein 34 n=1 Tax=Histomonas meleagridis TaxID=135588 RepID=UPI00355A0375|nr:Leucine-rich repeat-containing protein 34 [Histomonas meleagridis]KAH0797862.1 Leucine-rich repeat-containing protein 34 [Histomonas meleagridis]
MEELLDEYVQKCKEANIEPRKEFLNEIEKCITRGRSTLDVVIDGGIMYDKLTDNDFMIILDTLKKVCVNIIRVPRNNLTDAILPGVSQLLLQSDSIKQIDFSANLITSNGIKSLQDALVQSRSLIQISFAQNDIGDEGCMDIISSLRVNRNITYLDLSDTGISQNSLTYLGALIGEIHRLKCIHVDNPHNRIDGDSAAKRLFLSLCTNDSLTELSIARAKLSDDSALLISNFLQVNSILTNLRLRGNRISSVGAEQLANSLKFNNSLEVLDISNNKIGDKGAKAFAEMLKTNKTLRKIDVSSNGINGVGIIEFANNLPSNSSVTDLCLWGNKFVDQIVMKKWDELLKSPRGGTLCVDFEIHYTDDVAYVAKTPNDVSPKVWHSVF